MNEAVTEWLPKEAFTRDAIVAALASSVAAWSDAWFGPRAATIAAVRIGKNGAARRPAGDGFGKRGAVIVADLTEAGRQHLLEAALDVDFAAEIPSEQDHAVLDALAGNIAEDLVARLDAAFACDRARQGAVQIGVTLSVAGNDILAVAFPDNAVASMVKMRFGKPNRGNAPRRRGEALAPTKVIAEGLLGRAEIAVNDLKELAVGDVLILDRALSEQVELRLLEGGRNIGYGKLARNGARVSLQF